MRSSAQSRLLAIGILLVILAGLFVWAGTIEPDPADNNYPGVSDIHETPDEYVGDRISVDGTVVDMDPLTIETTVAGDRITFVIENADPDVAAGDHLVVFGTLQPNNHVTAIDTVHREPWEAYYMYVVSFLAGLWVLARLVDGWTLDTDDWTIVPRTDPPRTD